MVYGCQRGTALLAGRVGVSCLRIIRRCCVDRFVTYYGAVALAVQNCGRWGRQVRRFVNNRLYVRDLVFRGHKVLDALTGIQIAAVDEDAVGREPPAPAFSGSMGYFSDTIHGLKARDRGDLSYTLDLQRRQSYQYCTDSRQWLCLCGFVQRDALCFERSNGN